MVTSAIASNPRAIETNKMRGRVMRAPQHSWHVDPEPYVLQPICLAPVLAGDTLQSLSYQCRAISSPLKSALTGWNAEFFWFYCRIMDMDDGPDIMQHVIDESEGEYSSAEAGTANTPNYYSGRGIDWVERCQKLIIPHYFRDDHGAWDYKTIGGQPMIGSREIRFFEHFTADSVMPVDDVDAEDFENLWNKWNELSRSKLTTATYEEYLQQHGVQPPPNLRQPDADLKIPELIRHHRVWQFPISTISPTDGSGSHAVSFVVQDRAERSRRFGEPGFVIGFVTFRPKTYVPVADDDTNVNWFQDGFASAHLDNAKAWMPPIYMNEPGESLRKFTPTDGPIVAGSINTGAEDYWLDMRDLFLRGDQFVHEQIPSGETPAALTAVSPWTDPKYAANPDVRNLFKSATSAGIVCEGMASLRFKSHVRSFSR